MCVGVCICVSYVYARAHMREGILTHLALCVFRQEVNLKFHFSEKLSTFFVADLHILLNLTNMLDQWFSTFLMLQHFNTVPHVVVTPKYINHQTVLLLLRKCNYPTGMQASDMQYI